MDVLSQISKLFYFNVLGLADFMMYHWFPVSFFCANIVAHLCLQHLRRKPVFALSPSSCTYNSHIKKGNFLVRLLRILNSCVVYKF